jgi:hypothetical protein
VASAAQDTLHGALDLAIRMDDEDRRSPQPDEATTDVGSSALATALGS